MQSYRGGTTIQAAVNAAPEGGVVIRIKPGVYREAVHAGEHIGWSEWKGAPTQRLETATYGEYNSSGPGANAAAREPLSKQLTAEQAKRYAAKMYLAGKDGWNPEKIR